MRPIINRLSIIISLTAIMGVFIHDTQIDNATAINMKIPAISAEFIDGSALSRIDQHPLSEISSFAESTRSMSSQPATQPRNENDKKYISQKRLLANDFGSEYFWPSI